MFTHSWSTLSFLIFCFYGVVVTAIHKQSYPKPGPCIGDCIDIQDISIIQDATGKYYRFAGHHGIEIATAPSLAGPWKNSSTPAFPTWSTELAGLVPLLKDFWAPDVRKIGDTYYLFFTAEDFGTGIFGFGNFASAQYGVTFVATSKSLDGGTWTIRNKLDIPLNGPQYTRFDTSLLVEGDDIYMSFGSYSWGMFGIPMKSPPLQVLNQSVTMLVADDAVPGPQRNRSEGSYLFKHDDFYYIFYASGDCCPGIRGVPGSEYKIEYCRAHAVQGPYFSREGRSCLDGEGGTLLLPSHGDSVYAPGSPSVFHDPTHGLVLVYQYMDPHVHLGERHIRMGWNPLRFEDGWPVLHEAQIAHKPGGSCRARPQPRR